MQVDPSERLRQSALAKPMDLPEHGSGVRHYVEDMLDEKFGIDLDSIPDHWIPLGVTGALDWILICGWWPFEYTGVYDTEEQYKWIFNWDNSYEIDPDQLILFREDEELNAFHERIENPGIAGKERTEAVQFLIQDVYEQWGKEPPPQPFIEILLYCTFMWVLDEYGRDWLADKDPIFNCVYDFGVAYLMRWDNELLDPNLVECTNRPTHTCLHCESKVWCVLGYFIDNQWVYVCNNCAVGLAEATDEEGRSLHEVDRKDHRFRQPSCPQLGGDCTSTKCPWSGYTKEGIMESMREAGTQRVEEYRERMRMAGGSPRQLAGQTVEDIVAHYADVICPSCNQPTVSVKRLQEKVDVSGKKVKFKCPHCEHGIVVTF